MSAVTAIIVNKYLPLEHPRFSFLYVSGLVHAHAFFNGDLCEIRDLRHEPHGGSEGRVTITNPHTGLFMGDPCISELVPACPVGWKDEPSLWASEISYIYEDVAKRRGDTNEIARRVDTALERLETAFERLDNVLVRLDDMEVRLSDLETRLNRNFFIGGRGVNDPY